MIDMKLVLVEWGDAWVKAGAQKIDSLTCTPAVVQTVGYLVKESDQGVIVSPEYWPEDKLGINDGDEVGYPSFIPKGMILRIIPLMEAQEVPADPVA